MINLGRKSTRIVTVRLEITVPVTLMASRVEAVTSVAPAI